jgi:8-oxo-dGTP pyrophosphatase MutT (NUDIX family)
MVTMNHQKTDILRNSRFDHKVEGKSELRYVSEIKVNSWTLRNVFDKKVTSFDRATSFNLMLITKDHKVLLLRRTQSFHFCRVLKDLKKNKVDRGLMRSLYTSELDKLKSLKRNFLDEKDLLLLSIQNWSNNVYMFPGGHSEPFESILATLVRELQEETTITAKAADLRFNQTRIFRVLIHDLMIKKYFNNFIFPVKVDLTSFEVSRQICGADHRPRRGREFGTQRYSEEADENRVNHMFVSIGRDEPLIDSLLFVQKFMCN